MVLDKQQHFLQQIDKAAKLLDLLGDFPGAVNALKTVLDDPDVAYHKAIMVEVIAFLADICWHFGKPDDARGYLLRFEGMDISDIDPFSIKKSLLTLYRVKDEIARSEL